VSESLHDQSHPRWRADDRVVGSDEGIVLAFQDGVLTVEPHDVEDGIDTIPERTTFFCVSRAISLDALRATALPGVIGSHRVFGDNLATEVAWGAAAARVDPRILATGDIL